MTQQEFFGRYRFNVRTDKLGGGSFGTVYKAYDNVLDREVAVKVSEVKVMGGKEFSLMDEFRAIENLPAHPNIANYERVFTFEMPQGVYDYALIQYYPHGNLKDLIRERRLSESEKIGIARQLLNGLAFLHQNRVVHRDLKPSNILIHIRNRGNGEEIIPKIADFGLSKIAEGGNSRFDNSFGGGTLEYSSPEQLMGRELRFNTDLWAYSVIVYELFTGKPLFAPQTESTGSVQREKEIYDQILHGEIAQKLEALPQRWKQDMLACLVKEPELRAKSAADLSIITDDGKEISVPEAQALPGYQGSTVISVPYGGETVIAQEPERPALSAPKAESILPDALAGAKPRAGRGMLLAFAIAVAAGGLAVAAWWLSGNKNVRVAASDKVAKSDYGSLLKKGDSLLALGDTAAARKAYGEMLAGSPGDSLASYRISSLKKPTAVANSRPEKTPGDGASQKTVSAKSAKQQVFGKLKKKYHYVFSIGDGFYSVSDGDMWGIADPQGELVTPLKYGGGGPVAFSEGLAAVLYKGKYGFVDHSGKEVIPPSFTYASKFSEGLAVAYNVSHKQGFINRSGEIVIPFTFRSADEFSGGMARVFANGKGFYIDKTGNWVKDLVIDGN